MSKREEWVSFAKSMSSGDLVEVANIINAVGDYPSVEACTRAAVPAVVDLLKGYGIRVGPPPKRT